MSPPTHSSMATRCQIREFVPKSCAPPVAEWPVSAMGMTTRIEPTNSATWDHQLVAVYPPTATTAANAATMSHTRASATWSRAVDQAAASNSTVFSGWPETSESTSGIITRPISATPALAWAPVRDAMCPSTVRRAPLRSSPCWLGGTRKAASMNEPVASAMSNHATPRSAGNPNVVATPGSGMPSSASDPPENPCPTAPAMTAATASAARYSGQAGATVRVRAGAVMPLTLLSPRAES